MLTRKGEDSILSARELAATDFPDGGLGIIKPKPWWEQQRKRKHPNQTNGDHTHPLYPQKQPPTGY